ncbi:unnamed protein product [Caenorhabditis brenneri]
MKSEKPMSYANLRIFLPYLEANKRIQLASRAPLLRTMDKILPLTLESLKYGHDTITINETEYKVGVVRHYCDRKNYRSDAFYEEQEKLLKIFLKKLRILDSAGYFKDEESKNEFLQFLQNYTKGESFQKEHPEDKSDPWKHELAKLLDFYQFYPRQDTPEHIDDQNKRGGLAHDIDEYGFQLYDSLRTGEPGDVVMARFQGTDMRRNDDREMESIEKEYEEAKQKYCSYFKLSLLNSDGIFSNVNSMMEYLNFVLTHTDQEVYDYHTQLRDIGRYVSCCKERVEDIRDKLQPFYNRKYSIPLEYTPYIQLSVNGKPVQSVKYTKKLRCALRELFLTRRRDPVQVKTLIVHQSDIIRVPPGIKFKIRKLNLNGNLSVICDSLKPLIDDSSYPLEEVSATHTAGNEFQHETIRTARRLVIRSYVWLPTLLIIQNKNVHRVNDGGTLTVEDYIELIESWMNSEKEVGTTWSFGVHDQKTLTSLMEAIPHGNRVGETERSIPLPLTRSVLHVSYEVTSGAPEPWLLKMVVKAM